MEYQSKNGKHLAALLGGGLLALSFFVMPLLLAAVPGDSPVQAVFGNQVDLLESESLQAADINAISGEKAVKLAVAALEDRGFDGEEFEAPPAEVQYIAESAPAGDPVWAVIFRKDEKGYAYAFGAHISEEVREKIAALGKVEVCRDEDGTPGIRAYYSYTRYTLVEINAFSGQYIRHGDSIVEYGKPLDLKETHWTSQAEEAAELELKLQKEQ